MPQAYQSGKHAIHYCPRWQITSDKAGHQTLLKNSLCSKDGEMNSHYSKVVLWGSRVIISVPGRECLLEALHECHPGIVHMKAVVRSYLWWPGLDRDIELKVKSIASFQRTRTCIRGNGWAKRGIDCTSTTWVHLRAR